jgi:hypothetical protein
MIPFAALLSIGEKVLDKVIPDPEAKAKAQATLMEMAQRGELAQLEARCRKCNRPETVRFRLPPASLLRY